MDKTDNYGNSLMVWWLGLHADCQGHGLCPCKIIQGNKIPQVTRHAAAAAKLLQSCPILCDPIPGILQARTLEWVAISFSNAWKRKVKVKSLGHVRLFTTPWTAAYQAPPSKGFSRQEYWSGVPLPSPHKAWPESKNKRNKIPTKKN